MAGIVNTLTIASVSNEGGWSTINPETRIGIVLAISRSGGRMTIAWKWERLRRIAPRLAVNDSLMKVPSVVDGSLNEPRNTADWMSDRFGGWKHPLPFRGRFKGRTLYPGRSFYFVMIFKNIFMVSLCCDGMVPTHKRGY